jgi:NTE family protein
MSRGSIVLPALLVAATLGMAHAEPERPRVGLVLGGGGARGAAHVGVLEVLDRLRVPVDCVAGTSMGALVSGALASGLSPAQMRQALAAADWADMFNDDPDFAERNFRSKRLTQRYLAGSEVGLAPDGLRYLPGVLNGEKIKLFFNQLVHDDATSRRIEALALPLSIVATDIGDGSRVVFRAGSLTQAMRASMSVPGLLAPTEVDGRRLVDGGLVDNVPIGEVRERCRADVVIAVDVGSPLQEAQSVHSLLSVSTQMVGILTQQNVTRSLATLTPRDIYLRPDLGNITSTDFQRNGEAAERGRAAAEAVRDRLAALGVDEYAYATWRDRLRGVAAAPARVDRIEIAGSSRVDPAAVRRHIRQPLGEPLDARRLEQDLLRIYGDAHYEEVDYDIVGRDGANVLEVRPRDKSWGPDYMRFAIALNTTARRGSSYSLRGAFQRTLLNRLGGELLVSAELGTTIGGGIDFHQPLDAAQRSFFDARALRAITSRSVFNQGWKIAEYRVGRSLLEAAGGLNLGVAGQLRLGWQHHRNRDQLDTGIPVLPEGAFHWSGPFVRLELDQLDAPYFPSRGWAARAELFDTRDLDFTLASVEGRLVGSLGDQVFALRLAHTGSPRGVLPYFAAPTLGGLFNLSAFAVGQLLGDEVSYAGLRVERIVGRLPIGLRGDLRVGLAAEAGRVRLRYSEIERRGWNDSWAVYLGGVTPLGPVYLAYARSTRGPSNAYLVVGSP